MIVDPSDGKTPINIRKEKPNYMSIKTPQTSIKTPQTSMKNGQKTGKKARREQAIL